MALALNDSTAPKPFVFVLMPFDREFDDVYKFGIKGAAADVGAYAERVDDQIFDEGILDRIFNQISKADVLVAEMSGRNPNVFYEVGYAHALGKLVLLVAQNENDIPFDLQQKQHTIYRGSIDTLRRDLAIKLDWALTLRDPRTLPDVPDQFSVRCENVPLAEELEFVEAPVVQGVPERGKLRLRFVLRNDSTEDEFEGFLQAYLFFRPETRFVPGGFGFSDQPAPIFEAHPLDSKDGLTCQCRVQFYARHLSPHVSEIQDVFLVDRGSEGPVAPVYRMRFHTASRHYDFYFRIASNA